MAENKTIFKLSQGEYISAEYLEGIYSQHDIFKQIFVYGDSLRDYLVAIVVPDADFSVRLGKQKQLDASNVETFIHSKEFNHELLEILKDIHSNRDLKGLTRIKKLYVTTDEFSIENGLLTSTMKVRRNKVYEKYSRAIEELYSN